MELSATIIKELILPILLIIAALRYFRVKENLPGGLRNPLLLVVFAMAGLFAILAFFSPAFPESLLTLSNYLELALMIYLLRPLFKDSSKINWILIFIWLYDAVNCLFAGVQLIQGLHGGLDFLTAMEKLAGLFDQSVDFSAFLLLSIPVLILISIFMDKPWKIAAFILLAIHLIIILLQAYPIILGSLILSGFLGVLLILILLMNYRLSSYRIRQMIVFTGISLIFTATIISIGFFSDTKNQYQQKINAITDYQYGVKLEKADVWEQSMNLFRDERVTGQGLGNWQYFFPTPGVQEIRNWQKENPLVHPQNEFILLLSETGLAGFILFSLILVLSFINYIRRILGEYPIESKVLSTGFLFILLIIITLLLISDHFKGIELRFLFAMSVAGAIGSVQQAAENHQKTLSFGTRRMLAGGVILLVLGILLIRWDDALSWRNLNKMEAAEAASDYAAAAEFAGEAAGRLRNSNANGYPIAALEAGLLARQQKFEQAASLYRQAIRQAPANSQLLMQAGINELTAGLPAAGLNLLSKAHQLNPLDPEIQLYRSLALLEANLPDSAYSSFSALPNSFPHPNLLSIRTKLLHVRLASVLSRIDEPILQETIGRIVRDSAWTNVCWTHCRADNTHFDYQIVLEALYALEILDKSLPAADATLLRNKYLFLNKKVH